MAEYITKEQAQKSVENFIAPYIPSLIGYHEKMPLELAIAIRDIDAEDVVKRSKIDKAIAEIKELYTEWDNSTDEARLESNPFGAVLNIIQRNTGE